MAYGDGSIAQVKGKDGKPIRNCWRVTVPLGTDGQGKRRRKSKIVHGSKADARKVLAELSRDADQGLDVLTADRLTFQQLVDMWLPVKTRDMVKMSKQAVAARAEYLCRLAGSWKVKQITTQDCYALMDWLVESKAAEGTPIVGSTQANYLQTLRSIFKFAIDNGYIYRNPASNVKPPKVEETDRRSLSEGEASELLRALSGEYREALESLRNTGSSRNLVQASRLLVMRLVLATGMRRGEACGLPWRCVDFEAGTVRVEQSLSQDTTLHTPKTKAGVRTIAVDADTMAALLEWRGVQAEALSSIGIAPSGDSPVFTNSKGRWMLVNNVNSWWQEWRERRGFGDVKIHELRHTQATHLLGNNVDVKTVQERLGHSDASVTLNTYAHALPENDRKAADLIGDLFSRPAPRKVVGFKTA